MPPTDGEPATRMPYLQRPQYMWNVDHAVMGERGWPRRPNTAVATSV